MSQEAVKVVWYFCILKNVSVFVSHTVKGFGVVNKSDVHVFLEFLCFLYDPTDIGNLMSGSSAFSKTSLNIWKFMVHVLLKPGLDNFEHYFTSMWDECNCVVVWTFFGIAFCWDWNEHWTFLLQDAWIEGLALIFSFENFKIATCCWKTINRRMLDPTKKRCPTSMEKKKSEHNSRGQNHV